MSEIVPKVLLEDNQVLESEPEIPRNGIEELENGPNEKVLRLVMGYLDIKELVKMRPACKLWRDEVQRELVHKRTLEIKGGRPNMERAIKTFNQNALASFPMFRNFKLSLKWRNLLELKEEYQELMKMHGKYLQNFKLDFLSIEFKVKDLRDVFLPSLDNIGRLELSFPCRFIHDEQMYFPDHGKKILHNLTWLRITVDNTGCTYSPHRNTLVFQDILLLAPNLETLYWQAVGNGTDSEWDRTRHFVETLIAVNPPQLQNLFIYNRVTPTLAEAIFNSLLLELRRLYLVDVKTFRLDLAPRKNVVTPKLAQYTGGGQAVYNGLALKSVLENVLDALGNEPCTTLLRTFLAALTERNING